MGTNIILQSDSISVNHWLSEWFTPAVIIGIATFLLTLFLYLRSKSKLRPTITFLESIFDEYGNRFLFSVASNNPAGFRAEKLFISKRFLILFYINRTQLDYLLNNDFLNPKVIETIPKFLVQGEKTFVATIPDDFLTGEGTYKLSFYTSDGLCSQTFSYRLGKMFQRARQR